MPIEDRTGRMHADAGSKKGGQFVPKNYNAETGTWSGKDSWKNRRVTINFPNGTSRSFFFAGEENPLELKSDDNKQRQFDKLITMPLMLQNIDKWFAPITDMGCEIVDCGFGDEKYDEPLGVDFRINYKMPNGEIKNLKIDFKFIRESLFDFNTRALTFHIVKESGNPSQFVNGDHINDAFVYCYLDRAVNGNKLYDFIQMAKKGISPAKIFPNMRVSILKKSKIYDTIYDKFNLDFINPLSDIDEKVNQLYKFGYEQREMFMSGLIGNRDNKRYRDYKKTPYGDVNIDTFKQLDDKGQTLYKTVLNIPDNVARKCLRGIETNIKN